MMPMRLIAGLGALVLFSGCASTPTISAVHMPPADLIRAWGPPARIHFDETFPAGEKGQEYRYYFISRKGEVVYWGFFYNKHKWSFTIVPDRKEDQDPSRLRLLNPTRASDRKLIENYEASRPWLHDRTA